MYRAHFFGVIDSHYPIIISQYVLHLHREQYTVVQYAPRPISVRRSQCHLNTSLMLIGLEYHIDCRYN